MLVKGVTYTTKTGSLAMKILAKRHETDEYVKVKMLLLNKFCGSVYERKNYKLLKKNIKHWIHFED